MCKKREKKQRLEMNQSAHFGSILKNVYRHTRDQCEVTSTSGRGQLISSTLAALIVRLKGRMGVMGVRVRVCKIILKQGTRFVNTVIYIMVVVTNRPLEGVLLQSLQPLLLTLYALNGGETSDTNNDNHSHTHSLARFIIPSSHHSPITHTHTLSITLYTPHHTPIHHEAFLSMH